MKNKIVLSAIAISSALATGTEAASVAISVDFEGMSQISTLAPSQTAGVVNIHNWNSVGGVTGTGITISDDTNLVDATLSFSSTFSGNIADNFGTDANEVMMNGWLGYGPIAGGASDIQVRVMDISLVDLGWDSYDVIVYSNLGGPFNPSGLEIDHNILTEGFLTMKEINPAYGAPGSLGYSDGSDGVTDGNYVRFSGLTSDEFTLVTNTDGASPLASQFAAINGLQIVEGTKIPEPSSLLLTLGGAMTLLMRRRRS